MICWMNGEYMPQQQLKISPFDHGFLYGLGFFETFRTYDGKAIFLQQHIQRLNQALEAFHIEMPYSIDELTLIIETLNEKNGGDDGYFRLNVSAGEHEIGLAPTHYQNPNVIIFRKALPKSDSIFEKSAVILKTIRNTPEDGANRFKGHHYGNNVFARFELPSLAEREGIYLTKEGFVAEGITSNIFWVKHNVLYTPALSTGILPGITRANVIQLAHQLGIEVVEGKLPLSDLMEADECFMTTAIQQIVPISQIEGKQYKGTTGEFTSKLKKVYEAFIEKLVKEPTT